MHLHIREILFGEHVTIQLLDERRSPHDEIVLRFERDAGDDAGPKQRAPIVV